MYQVHLLSHGGKWENDGADLQTELDYEQTKFTDTAVNVLKYSPCQLLECFLEKNSLKTKFVAAFWWTTL